MSQWTLAPILDSYLLVFGTTAVLLALLAFVTPTAMLSTRRQRALIFLRLIVILLAFIGMLRPTWVHSTLRPRQSTVILLADQSRSMSIEDVSGESRWQAQRQALEGALGAWQPSQATSHLEVLCYGFQSTPHALAWEEKGFMARISPDGPETDIGSSLDAVLQQAAGKRLAGVVLLSDGAQRARTQRVDLYQPARDLARAGCPLYVIPFGRSRDQSQARDVAVENLPDQFTVFANNTFRVHAQLRTHGYVNQAIPITMTVEGTDGKRDTVGPITLRPMDNGQRVDIEFDYTPRVPGQYTLSVEAAAQPGEWIQENNRLSAILDVREGGLRLLHLYGNVASEEQKFVRRSLDASADMQWEGHWLDARVKTTPTAEHVAETRGNAFDVFILDDVAAATLGPEACEQLVQQVERGKGLLMIGGYQSFGAGGYADTPLARALPVLMDRLERQDAGEPLRTDLHYDRPIRMIPSQPHFITRLAPDDQNGPAWQQLPPLAGANRITQLQERARVLIKGDGDELLLVAHEFGAGRVLAFAGDTTYRWYKRGHAGQHKRFWRQMILWLAQKEQAQRDQLWIRLEPRRYVVGSPVAFEVGARTAEGDPLTSATFRAEILDPSGKKTSVPLVAAGDTLQGVWDKTSQAGEYQVLVTGNQGDQPLGATRAPFLVLDQDLELSDPAAYPDQLQRMADLTRDAGGRVIAPNELLPLLRKMQAASDKMEVEKESKWQLGDSPLDASGFLLLFTGVLTLEWYLRKKWGHV